MELNAIMSSQLASLQQTLQLSLLDQTLNNGASASIEMLQSMPVAQDSTHPYKGTIIDISI